MIGLAGAATGLATGWFAAPVLIRPSAGLIGSANAQPPTLRMAIAVTALALTIAVAATLVPVVRAAATSTVHALADAATPPRRRRGRIWLSRRLPTAVLIGVRINARRPRRARLVTVNTLITTTALVAMLIVNTRVEHFDLGYTEAVAQLLPAIPGVVAGTPAGIGLVAFVSTGEVQYPPGSWLLATALGVLLAFAALTAVPAMVATRRPVVDVLRSAPT